MMFSEFLQFSIKPLHGKSHDIEITALYAFHPDETYPLLNAIGPCLVSRVIVGDIMDDLLLRERGEGDMADGGKRHRLLL